MPFDHLNRERRDDDQSTFLMLMGLGPKFTDNRGDEYVWATLQWCVGDVSEMKLSNACINICKACWEHCCSRPLAKYPGFADWQPAHPLSPCLARFLAIFNWHCFHSMLQICHNAASFSGWLVPHCAHWTDYLTCMVFRSPIGTTLTRVHQDFAVLNSSSTR